MATARVLAIPARPATGFTWPWTYVAESGRDLRLDLLRGFCVFAMIADHVGGDSYAHAVSGAGEFFVSAAEGFVFLSGFVMGMVYSGVIERAGLLAAMRKAVLRTWTLYRVTIGVTVIFGVELAIHGYEIGPFESWPRWIADVLTLHQTLYLGDIPLVYTLLVATGALALTLLSTGRTVWLLSASGGLWLAYQLNPDWGNTFPWTIANNTMFHFASWQAYFVSALALGYHRRNVTTWFARVPKGPLFFAASGIFALMLYLHLSGGSQLPDFFQREEVRDWLDGRFQKGSAGPLRLLAAALIFQFAFLFVTYFWRPLRGVCGWLLLPLGQSSLYAYAVHVILIGLAYASLDHLGDASRWPNTVAQIGVLLLVWSMVKTRFLFRVVPR